MDEMFAGKRWGVGLLIEDFDQLNFEQAAKWYFSWLMKLNLPWSINISVLLLLNIFEVRLDFTLCLSQISCMMKA
jgi:EAL domain-containing protein (putative c-di-GMP-specific phosphodiesterase class I)